MVVSSHSQKKQDTPRPRTPAAVETTAAHEAGDDAVGDDWDEACNDAATFTQPMQRYHVTGTSWGRHIIYKWGAKIVSDKDTTKTGGYKGEGMGKLWKEGLGRSSAGGISGKLHDDDHACLHGGAWHGVLASLSHACMSRARRDSDRHWEVAFSSLLHAQPAG